MSVADHGRQVLMVTGGRSFRASPRFGELETGLATAGVTLVGNVAVTGEPAPEEIERAVERYRGADVEVILGVGGGSVSYSNFQTNVDDVRSSNGAADRNTLRKRERMVSSWAPG